MRPAILLLVAILSTAAAGPAGAGTEEIVPPPSRDVTPPGVTPAPAGDGPLIREAVPPPPPEPPRWRRFHLPETLDAATFRVEGRTIRVAGLAAPDRDATCGGTGEEAWPCGRTALHALRMFLRGRAIECFYPHAGTATDITAPCRVGGTDLGLWLLSAGWAKPDQLATEGYRAAAEAARCSRKGIWRHIQPADCPEAPAP